MKLEQENRKSGMFTAKADTSGKKSKYFFLYFLLFTDEKKQNYLESLNFLRTVLKKFFRLGFCDSIDFFLNRSDLNPGVDILERSSSFEVGHD